MLLYRARNVSVANTGDGMIAIGRIASIEQALGDHASVLEKFR